MRFLIGVLITMFLIFLFAFLGNTLGNINVKEKYFYLTASVVMVVLIIVCIRMWEVML